MKKILIFLFFLNVCPLRAQTLESFVISPLVTIDCIASMNVLSVEEMEHGDESYIIGIMSPIIMQQIIDVESEIDAILPIWNDETEPSEIIYDELGRQLNYLKNGINLVRMSDGTIKKVVM